MRFYASLMKRELGSAHQFITTKVQWIALVFIDVYTEWVASSAYNLR